jgi:hypothetical protein
MKNKTNEYANALGDILDKAPKTVLAAIAVSALTTGGDEIQYARIRVLNEWQVLYDNGIVSQKPPRS